MTLKAPTIVIFDMDGTTVRHINPRLLQVMEFLDDTSFRIKALLRWPFSKNRETAQNNAQEPQKNRRKKMRLLVHRAIHKFRRKPVDQIVEPCPGIYAVLNLLQTHETPMAIVSNGLGKGYGHEILEKFDLEKYFSATIFREDITKSKPDPEPLLLALQHMKQEPKDGDVIWYIGDRHKDVSAALAAKKETGHNFIPVAYGLNAAVAVLDNALSPSHICMCYNDMFKTLKTLLSKGTKQDKKSDKQQKLFA